MKAEKIRHILFLIAMMLFVLPMQAAKVTYHILTLPITSDYHMKSDVVVGHRLEAVKVVVDKQSTVELPAHYKSPLATGFTYYAPADITIGATVQLYTGNSNTKGTLYDVKGGATPIEEGTTIPGTTAEYYVVYTYNSSNAVAQLDGSQEYNIHVKGKGFLALNRGRNNRPAVVPEGKVDAEMLASEDFVKIENPGGGITTYWTSGDNKNKKEEVESQFHFIFRFEGSDPYNIIIRTCYNRDYTYIEKNDDGDKKFVYKWYKGGQLFSVGTANSYIASDDHKRYQKLYNSAEPNPTEMTEGDDYILKEGQFHGQTSGAIWSSYALLNNTTNDGFVFMGTRTVDGSGAVPTPGGDNKYNYLKLDNNNLTVNKHTATEATKNYTIERFYALQKVTFKVPSPFYAIEATEDHIISAADYVSQYTVATDPIETKYLPTSLKRKYCEWTGKFYSDAARTHEITHFSQANYDNTEGYQVYLGYEVSGAIPFHAITPSASYTTATWYELTDAGSTQEYGRKIKWNSTEYKNNGGNGEYNKESEFAFVGDPYELKVLYRKGTEDAGSNTYVTLRTYDSWEIPVDAVSGSFLLRKYNDAGYWYWDAGQPTGSVTYQSNLAYNAGKDAQTITFTVSGLAENKYIKVTTGGTDKAQIISVTPTVNTVVPETSTSATVTVRLAANTSGANKTMTVTIQEYTDDQGSSTSGTASVITITQGTSSSSFAGNTVDYHATNSTYVKPLELPNFTYIYNMVDNAGLIAVKGTATQTIFSTLTKASIPSVVLSPFLMDETVTFYSTFTEGDRAHLSGTMTETPPTDNTDIFVSYTTSHLSSKSIKLSADQQFKVNLNGEYLYYDTSSSKVLSTPTVGTENINYYTWRLEGGDPYSMKIYNVGLGKYVNVASWGNNVALGFDESIGNASRFVAMLGNYTGIYEVMAATGSTDYYHIGRPSSTGAEAKIYSTATYDHGADQLRFELAVDNAIQYTLIDQAGDSLLTVSSFNPRLTLPAEYVSPLVDTYYYYRTKEDALTNNKTNNIEEITDDDDNHVWVRYTVNDLIGFNNTGRVNDHPYLLRFLEPYASGYYLEDGNDKLTTTLIQAVYPYCNGDGNLNIYGSAMRDEQMNGGSSTRPRWVWFFESANEDPYHVRIHSRSTISYNSVANPTYLETKAVHFNQDGDPNTKHIVTGGALPGVASEQPTEYMVLGLPGAFKLVTTSPINDGTTNERRTVTSFEQYWKTYNMLKLHILGISASIDAYSEDESTWVVPTTGDYRTTLAARDWHSYSAYANAVRWNGYNDKASGHEKKIVEKLEHWYQTFDMGNGTFDIEDADIPPVLVLLDQHGWEIMRRPLPVANYPLGEEELAALRVYDSPLVKEYKFYSQATKSTGCHKYTLRMQNGAERDQIKVNGVHYTSTSLADLPPANASGVKSSGVLNDQFVTYTVKEEYDMSYDYNLTYTGDATSGYTITSETGTAEPYLVLQNGRFYKIENDNSKKSYITKPIFEHAVIANGNIYDMIMQPKNNTVKIIDDSGEFIGNNFWYVKPNLRIDEEMGIKWGAANSGSEPMTQAATQVTYKDKSGFDPYNMQLQLVKKTDGTPDGRYLTTHMVSTRIENGVRVGSYTGTDYYEHAGSTMITLEPEFNSYAPLVYKGSEGYDHTNLQMSNQTFMAVSDANGNLQLMPRFDHTKRVNVPDHSLGSELLWATTLEDPVDHAKASADNNNSMGPQTTFFVHPYRFIYHIIDNVGREALVYKRSGDDYPTITEHFKSPLAKDFTYYTGLAETEAPAASSPAAWAAATGDFQRVANNIDSLRTLKNLLPTAGTYQFRVGTRGVFSYYSVEVTKGLLEKQITGSFEDKKLFSNDNHVYVRYDYDEDADFDAERILMGQWFTVKLDGKDLQSSGTVVTTVGESQGTGVKLYADADTPLKPATIDSDDKIWQWKFLTAPTDPSSDYYEVPDPYAVHLFNRQANYTKNPSLQPSPMAVGIKVPDATTGTDRFALLAHPSGGYALAVAKTYTDNNYPFLNGGSMTASVAATTANESSFNYKNGTISADAQVLVTADVVYHYCYNVITNDSILATKAGQNNDDASLHNYEPYLPDSVQTPLLNMEDYLYYGFVRRPNRDTFAVIEQTKLYTLYGLYDDTVYVRYNAYDPDKTEFQVPNEKDIVDSHVARGDGSHDVSMNISGGLPYNIIWYNDNMMTSIGETKTITFGTDQNLTGNVDSVWYFTGNDPYALRIKHKKSGSFVNGTTTLVDSASSVPFMLLKKDGYDYGILQVSRDTATRRKLTDYGQTLTADAATAPTKFIIFGLSVHDLIYRLIIAKTCPDKSDPQTGEYVDIPYREGGENTYSTSYEWTGTETKRIYGTSQRNLTSKKDDDDANPVGSKYQLGTTISWGGNSYIYGKDVGPVSIGDDLWVPNEFYRPNCTFEFYIEGVYSTDGTTAQTDLNNRFKGLKREKLMTASDLIDKTVVVNIVYKFNDTLATNTGLGFVTSTDQNLWYTFETPSGATPYLAHYTNAWGLQSMPGRETRYTNDYIWTPLGDVYGFKMYNRYMLKNSNGVHNVMTMAAINEGQSLLMAEPGTGGYTEGNEIFELLAGDQEGYFRVHPVVNNSGTQYYVWRDPSDNYTKLSATPCDWRFGLDMTLLEPYHERAGYVGGLTADGKTAYETAVAGGKIIDIQNVVYNDANIVHYTPGYYRLHNQPDVSGISTLRYASGYLHDIEKTAVSGGIPMHFYSKSGVSSSYTGEEGLGTGFTTTAATRGDIPIDPTECDPSTIFYFPGNTTLDGNPRSTMQTQGLYVAANANGDPNNGTTTDKRQRAVMSDNSANAITFSLMDIGGAVLLIHDGAVPATRRYLNFDQSNAANIYDLKYYHESPADDAKWCMKPVQKSTTAGNGEMPLILTTNNGGDGYYYATFYAPFDVLLPNDGGGHTYNAYTCKKWYNEGVNPKAVPAAGLYEEGKFVPAGTPVIIRTNDESGSMTLALPTTTPSEALSCIFTGSYLEKKLEADGTRDVYTFGLPMTSDVSKAADYNTSGDIVAPLPEFANTDVGFYINATRNKESDPLEALWTRNNLYVLHNKIYYRAPTSTPAPGRNDIVYVPVNFGDEDEEQPDEQKGNTSLVGESGFYDILGRRYNTLPDAPGIYIVNGQKIIRM